MGLWGGGSVIGVVADDLTGAHDIGSMFVKSGALVYVFSYTGDPHEPVLSGWEIPDVLILDTNSRFDTPMMAYKKVFQAIARLRELGCDRFYKKICSAFRGNIGSELDAMLDATGEGFAAVIAGFPKNGRQTIHGIHYVHGVKLEESEFRFDPVHPMTSSNLVDILQSQTKRRVGLIPKAVVEQGSTILRKAVEQLKGIYDYVIMDVADQDSIEVIAEGLHHLPVLVGSSAMAEELPVLRRNGDFNQYKALPKQAGEAGGGVLCAAGSLMPQTAAQVEYMRQRGAPVFELDSLRIMTPDQRTPEIEELSIQIGASLQRGEDVVVHTANDSKVVAETKAMGQAQGLTTQAISRVVSGALAEVVSHCIRQGGPIGLLIAGGDTSAAVCANLGITGMRVWQEIEPGIPSCISLTEPPLMMVLKAGGFGKPDFFAKAVAHLKDQGR